MYYMNKWEKTKVLFCAIAIPFLLDYLCQLIAAAIALICHKIRVISGNASYVLAFCLSALGYIEQTTRECESSNGGRRERFPNRLLFNEYRDFRSCEGRYEGSFYPIEANFVMLAIFVCLWLGFKYYSRSSARFRALLDYLAELFVVTKPVELTQQVLVDADSYKDLVKGKESLEQNIREYETRIAALQLEGDWCQRRHANPDAVRMKGIQNELARAQEKLDCYRRDIELHQMECRLLRDLNRDLQKTDTALLRKTITVKEADIDSLRAKIATLEACRDTAHLKIEKEKTVALQKQIAVLQKQLQEEKKESIDQSIVAGLGKETIAKLERSNGAMKAALKAAEEQSQTSFASHKQAMIAAKAIIADLELRLAAAESQIGQASDEHKGAGLGQEAITKLEISNEALQAALKAAEEQAQTMTTSHRKARKHAKVKIEELEVKAAGAEFQLKQANDELETAKTANQKLEEELNGKIEGLEVSAAGAEYQFKQASEELEATKANNQKLEEELKASKQAHQADREQVLKEFGAIKVQFQESFDREIQAAELRLAEAAEAEIASRTAEAFAAKARADALWDLEFEQVAKEAAEMQARVAVAAAAPAAPPVASTPAAGPAIAPATPPRKRPVRRRVIPGLGNLPQHVVAHGQAQENAALDFTKFLGSDELPDVNMPFQGVQQRDESYDPDKPHPGFNLS